MPITLSTSAGNGYATSMKASVKPSSNGNGVKNGHVEHAHQASSSSLLNRFIDSYTELQAYKGGKPVVVDGKTLSIPAVTAAARYGAAVALDEKDELKEQVANSRAVIVGKVNAETSVYGHQHAGVLPSQMDSPTAALPLLDPLASTSMPEAWVRGAILIRMNSLIRGHSGVRWELIEKMGSLLKENVTPLVPMRGSISASGDLSPLSYIAGTLIGNPSIRVFDGPAKFGHRQVVPSTEALAAHGIEPIPLASKEHLGILNGTAFSASVAALALDDAIHLTMLAHVCTAMGVEALLGAQGSFEPFIHDVARPHPGQVESAAHIRHLLEGTQFAVTKEEERSIKDDAGELRQDRYPLRTAAQFLGPQIEDILHALAQIQLECNTTTDNPLIEAETDTVHHGGNFQAMAVTNAMEKTRLALHHIGKLLFSQCTEILNPAMNRGLPPSVAATDPSLNYHAKGVDIHIAAYTGELGYLANPVSTHIQSAEMHNQAVNSLALISGRATINSLEVLSLLTASYLYALCQALDLRALQHEFEQGMKKIVEEQLPAFFGSSLSPAHLETVFNITWPALRHALDATSTMDAVPRMQKVAAASTTPIVDFCLANGAASALTILTSFRDAVAEHSAALLADLRKAYLTGERGAAPAAQYLGRTRGVYEFIRVTLGVRMHGKENLDGFADGPGVTDATLGQNVSLIYESIRDGKMQGVVVGLFQ
ncbi:hypothetical protein EVJ58_g1968 [Rhodofomes roseus]|uniref:Phenylalanine ammonia-lyase n=1 Tax=Rhodofomes roseus TaxID=34475 RepID=A0A4Y9YV42_9APHY|nr:hypothetical protein EVJ58_g1968 [Rhodofomes roseus]